MTGTTRRALRAHGHAEVAPGGRLINVASEPPLTLRKIFSENNDICALCLVGSAAGPLPGDELALTLTVRDDAKASVIASGATIAQGHGAAIANTEATVGADATLDVDPGELIITAHAHLQVNLRIDLRASSTLRWREVLVLGRANELSGTAVLRWNVTVDGRPLLRQVLDLSDRTQNAWAGMVGTHRVITTELRYGPDLDAHTIVHSPTDVTQKLAEHAVLRTTLSS